MDVESLRPGGKEFVAGMDSKEGDDIMDVEKNERAEVDVKEDIMDAEEEGEAIMEVEAKVYSKEGGDMDVEKDERFSCALCPQKFTFKQNLKRHVKARHPTTEQPQYQCDLCKTFFRRRDYVKRHIRGEVCKRKQRARRRQQPNVLPIIEEQVPPIIEKVTEKAANVTGGALKPRETKRAKRYPATVHLVDPEEPPAELIESCPYPDIVKRYWRAIRTSHVNGSVVQDRFNYRWDPKRSWKEWGDIFTRDIFETRKTHMKINASFGFVLRNNVTMEERYFHSCQNNTRILDEPFHVSDLPTFRSFLEQIQQEDILEWVRQQRPDTQWVVDAIANITLFVNNIRNHPMGVCEELPAYLRLNRGLLTLRQRGNRDNLCVFRCLACHVKEKEYQQAMVKAREAEKRNPRRTDRLESVTKELFRSYCQEYGVDCDVKSFPGLSLEELHKCERLFKVDINVYTIHPAEDEEGKPGSCELIRRALDVHKNPMNLNLYGDHVGYITDLKLYSNSYMCPSCSKMWKSAWLLKRHLQTCKQRVKYIFKGGVYSLPQTIFQRLEHVNISVPEQIRYYPFFITYDAEAFLSKDVPESNCTIHWQNKHVPLSISVCSNIPGFKQPKCFVNRGSSEEMLRQFLEHLTFMACAAKDLMESRFKSELARMQELAGDEMQNGVSSDQESQESEAEVVEEEDAETGKKKKKKKRMKGINLYGRLYTDFKKYLMRVPVVGFNSGKYDINLLKPDLLKVMKDKESEFKVNLVIRKGNNYMALSTQRLRFVDITNYLAPGFSYDRYLKAYSCELTKGSFPYEWMDDLDKLKYPALPPYEAFYSKLKGCNISREDYQYAHKVWHQKKMESFCDYLVWYNNRDVEPFVEAVSKQMAFYGEKGIDMFKDGYSVPGLTMRYLFQGLPKGVYFTLYGEENKDVHNLIKANLVGGPSVVFHRYHERDVTRLREGHLRFEETKVCRKVLGYDANALYLFSLMKPMPTGRLILRRSENKFRPERSQKYGYTARQWLEWLMRVDPNLEIQHLFNGAEKKIGIQNVPVDGWDQKSRTVFQFHGCYWHGHECSLGQRAVEEVRVRRRKATVRVAKNIIQAGFKLVEMWECQWREKKNNDPVAMEVVKSLAQPIPGGGASGLKEEDLLALVKEGTVFGMVQCDIEVPAERREYFSEMQPIFKNTLMTRDHLGTVMREFAELNGILKQPRRTLVGSFHAQGILLSTTMLRWYLQKGLVVKKVYLCVQFTPNSCFEHFGQEVTSCRRRGDENPHDHAVLADTMKLLGNSGYGKTITNKDKFTKVSFCNSKEALEKINGRLFKNLQPISDSLYEVEEFNTRVVQDLPLQIGFFVYQEAKLHMLKFYYDFIDKYVRRCDYQYCQMDTDSAYMAISGETLEDVVVEELREDFYREWDQWFPAEVCDLHKEEWVLKKVYRIPMSKDLPSCCSRRRVHDKRTPGLFKLEWSGDGIIALCSKTYMCFSNGGSGGHKVSTKGLSKRTNNIRKEEMLSVLRTTKPVAGCNRSFRMHQGQMYTYTQVKHGLSFFYGKRRVLEDFVSTEPTTM